MFKKNSHDPFWRIHLASWVIYFLWVYFGQNVIHKSRHVLPLLPLILLICLQAVFFDARGRRIRQAAFTLFLIVHSYITLHLVMQHRSPSAIYQVKQHLQALNDPDLHIVTVPLIEYYLSSQDVKAVYIVVEDGDLSQLRHISEDTRVVTIGNSFAFSERPLRSRKTFYHNPYVNRMWSEIDIYEY